MASARITITNFPAKPKFASEGLYIGFEEEVSVNLKDLNPEIIISSFFSVYFPNVIFLYEELYQ